MEKQKKQKSKSNPAKGDVPRGASLLLALGVKLAEARAAKGFTIEELAAKSGISSVTISQLMNGKLTNTSVGTVDKICEALSVDVHIMIISRS